jgi:excinuclease UvrABC helicase subunit UvrB
MDNEAILKVLLHGQSEDVKARTTAHLVHKTVHEAFTNHNKVLATTTGNVLKEVFFRAPVDQVGPSYFNGYNPLTIGSSFPSSSQQPNGGQCQQRPVQ